MRYTLGVLFILLQFTAKAQLTTLFEQSKGTRSPGYFEIIDWWKKAARLSPVIRVRSMDTTDAGYPLHLVLVSSNKNFNIASAKAAGKNIIFINNGIHPGEPDGIDASMLLVKDIIEKKTTLPSNIILAIIPVYNIGGCLNRSSYYRIDQDGPAEKGFRGNSQNLDLNRDFIKCDSRDALAFTKIFRWLDPDVMVDNHVSNGADYQHAMTLLTTQHNKLGNEAGSFIHTVFEPALYRSMQQKGYDLVPYVNHFGENPPDTGWTEFWDSPRYSSGYAAQWNTFAFVPETHMLKPYTQRVAATKALLESFITFTSINSQKIKQIRTAAKAAVKTQASFPVSWKIDSSAVSHILFKGFAAGYKTSIVSELPRLYYDRNKPYEKQIPFYNTYRPQTYVTKPKAYLIPQGWWKVTERLKANKVIMRRLQKDTLMIAEWYSIDNYKSLAKAYEGHHLNTGITVQKHTDTIRFSKGDYYIPLNQEANRFLIETLEPYTEDSYFAWNFFDPIFQQKEYFSDYVFEETAATFLQQHPEVKAAFDQRKATDTVFAKSHIAQLDFIYRQTPYYEPAYLRYPVYRIL
jgi:hypothetical protein